MLAGLFAGGAARADWPMARHDAKRSAFANGKSNITKPAVAWSTYLGGGLNAQQLLGADVDGDGHDELIRATGGSIAAIKADGTVVWKANTSGVTQLLGIVDLVGDGKKEVVGYTPLGAVAVDLLSGKVVWSQPVGEMGQVRNVRMGDLNGDGHPDLVIGECQGCGADKMQSGYIYSFASGFGAPIRSPLPYPGTNDGNESTLANMDGQGGAEVVVGASPSTLALVDGTTGMILATTADLGVGTGYTIAGCLAGDVDGVPGDEVVCIASAASDPSPSASEITKVFAVHYQPGTNTLGQLWSYTLEPNEGISNGGHDLLVDLDGDGHFETVVTGRDASGNHNVHILDAGKGKEIASIPGESLLGTAAALPNGRRVLITKNATGFGLWALGNGGLKQIGTLDDDVLISTNDWDRFPVSSAGYIRPAAIDADGDGNTEILTFQSSTTTLHAYRLGQGMPKLVGSLAFTSDNALAGLWLLPPIDQSYPQIAIARADGFLRTLDHSFNYTPVNVKLGGFYAPDGYRGIGSTPVIASLDGGPAQQVLVTDPRHTLLRIDASKATPDTPPVLSWSQPFTYSPVITPTSDGAAIFALHVVDPLSFPAKYSLRRLSPDGNVVWETPMDNVPPADLAVGNFDNDGMPDVALQSITYGSTQISTAAISGADGHAIWSTTIQGCDLQGEGVAVADWDGDGLDDVMQQAGLTHIASGADGHEIAKGGPPDCYYVPIPVAVNESLQVVYTAGFNSERGYAHDLSTLLFQSADDDRPFPYGSIAQCPDGPTFVQGSLSAPSRIKLTPLAGPSAYMPTSIYLAGGQLFHDADTANKIGYAQLTPASIHANLTGSGEPAAVVGAPDGWLYAFDPCTGELVFSYQFGAAVGEPVFGDTDGDGLDEIVVTVADGYLYALHNEPVVMGTGGGGGSGGSGGFGGAGGSGGHSGGPWIPLYGRGGCYCSAGGTSPAQGALALFAIGIGAAIARRSRWGRPPNPRPGRRKRS